MNQNREPMENGAVVSCEAVPRAYPTQVDLPPKGRLERKRFLQLAGIAAWARPELAYLLDRIGWPLRETDWGPYQATVERILQSVDELNVALGNLETEMNGPDERPWLA
jgi:hypothetical protein